MSGPTLLHYATFAAVMVLALIGSPLIVRGFSLLYETLGVYHYVDPDRAAASESIVTSDCESFSEKCFYVASYNLAAVLPAVLLISMYQRVPFSIPVTPASTFAVAVLITVMHTTIRIAAFVDGEHLYFDDPQKEHVFRIRDRALGFGFSFMVTIYFILLFTLGLKLVTGQIGLTVGINIRRLNLLWTSLYALGTLASVALGAVFGEAILRWRGVKDDLKQRV